MDFSPDEDDVRPRKKLIIELDGLPYGRSTWSSRNMMRNEQYISKRGYRVLRFWNNDVIYNTETVLNVIWSALNEVDQKA